MPYYNPEKRQELVAKVDALVASGEVQGIYSACQKVGITASSYKNWTGATKKAKEAKRKQEYRAKQAGSPQVISFPNGLGAPKVTETTQMVTVLVVPITQVAKILKTVQGA